MHAYIKSEVTHSVSLALATSPFIFPTPCSLVLLELISKADELSVINQLPPGLTSPMMQLWQGETPHLSPQSSSFGRYTPIPSASSHPQGTIPVCTGTALSSQTCHCWHSHIVGFLILAPDSSEQGANRDVACVPRGLTGPHELVSEELSLYACSNCPFHP